jgi:predicted acyl esterase
MLSAISTIITVLSLLLIIIIHPSSSNTIHTLNNLQLITPDDKQNNNVIQTLTLSTKPTSHTRLQYTSHSILHGKFFGGMHDHLNPKIQAILNHFRKQLLAKNIDPETFPIEISYHMIPMRDGVHLSTMVFNPAPFNKTKSAIWASSPYGPTSDNIADVFLVTNGFVAIVQDQRGTFLSEGEFTMWHSAARDGKDTIEWAVKQPWSNGKVFTVGISADGCASLAVLLEEPKSLRGQLLQWASADGHETTFPGGSFREGLITGWMTLQAPLTHGTSLLKTLPDVLTQDKLSSYWDPVQGPGRWGMVHWPTVHIAGWWDIFNGHQLDAFNGISTATKKAGLRHVLVVGPIGHCLLGNLDPYLEDIEADALLHGYGYATELFSDFETGTAFRDRMMRINIWVQGSRVHGRRGEGKVGHYWSSFEEWPSTITHRLFLSEAKSLIMTSQAKQQGENNKFSSFLLRGSSISNTNNNNDGIIPPSNIGNGYVEYSYDPNDPVIVHGGNNLVLMLLGYGCGSEDQRRNERRPDVVVFDTEAPLDAPLAILGRVKAILYVSSNRNDTDFHVSLTDVHPDGASMQIRYGLRRMRYRDSTPTETKITPMIPGHVHKVEIDMWYTAYILAPGHRFRVTISSSSYPYWAKNDNSGLDHDALGVKREEIASNKIHFSKEYPSHVEIPVVNVADLPKNSRI